MHSTLSLEVAPSVRRERGTAQLLGAWSALVLSAVATSAGALPWALHAVIATTALVLLMVVAHDAIHSAAHADLVINRRIGWLASFACAVPFVMLQSNHLRHHRLVGTEEDPERFCLGPAWQLLARWPAMLGFYWVETWPRLGAKARAQAAVFGVAMVAAVVFFPALLVLWVAPLLLAATLFALCTVWLPHGPLADVVMRRAPWLTGFHDDHHARPAFPVHQYGALHRWHVAQGVVTRQPRAAHVPSSVEVTQVAEALVTKLSATDRAFDVAPALEAATVALLKTDVRLASALGAVRRGSRVQRALGQLTLALEGGEAVLGGLDLTLRHALATLSYHPAVRRAVQAELAQDSARLLACVVRETVRLHPVPGARVPHQAWKHPQAFDPSRFAGDTRSSSLEGVAVAVLAVVLAEVRVDVRAGFKARPGVGLEVRVVQNPPFCPSGVEAKSSPEVGKV